MTPETLRIWGHLEFWSPRSRSRRSPYFGNVRGEDGTLARVISQEMLLRAL